MKVLVFVPKGFITTEFGAVVDVLGWAKDDFGCDIQVITCGFQKEVTGTFNIPIIVEKTIDEVFVDDYAAIAIPGGFEEYGFYEEVYNKKFLELIKDFHTKNKIIATICVGALPLGKSGILKNRIATTYSSNNGHRLNQLKGFGISISNEPIVVDGNIITSNSPKTALDVALILLEMLTSRDLMEKVKMSMGFVE